MDFGAREAWNLTTGPRLYLGFAHGKVKFFVLSGRIDHHGCMEVVMQGLRAHSDSFLAAMCLECYVLLHYFERARATNGGFWSQVSMERDKVSSTLPPFCLRKTRVCCVLGFDWRSEMG